MANHAGYATARHVLRSFMLCKIRVPDPGSQCESYFSKSMKMTQALVLSCKEVCLKYMHVHCQKQLVPIYMHSHTLTGVM